ncbi:hypothetical protein TRFO_35876 [Tritrichomonas foetus]|uniref:Leucine Rich Repeat family protein n=1 Tax=Tritrichomonas foetus TaxID=1144522 RepID=A0A1J4JF77_9EUKA|nr:hypothetical protein TRFO_35876 [Tritrichomonas foetus]|eukprot:OHS97862.1 hypothetical protein TRFO_35876 [Tritrichomonas foetus]
MLEQRNIEKLPIFPTLIGENFHLELKKEMADCDDDQRDAEILVNAAKQSMWGTVTLNFLKEHVLNGIVSLDLTTNLITFESAEYLSTILKNPKSSLKYLSLIESRLTQKAADIIFESIGDSTLIEFYADDNVFPEEQCKVLAESLKKNPPLELLSLCGCDIPSGGGIAIAEALPSNSHLKHLRIESNSLYDFGAKKLGEVIPKSSLISLNIADNEIWAEGTTAILTNLKFSQVESLDLSYNIVDLNVLNEEIEKTKIKDLALSGCKVHEQLFPAFLGKIPTMRLQTLILDGFNFQTLPISWPRVKDTLWSTCAYFDDLMLALQQSQTIVDLRVGFLDMDQIFGLKRLIEDGPERSITISMHDFGRTGNCWVVHLPEFKFEAPCSTFRWNSSITLDNCELVGSVIQNATVFPSSDTSDTPAAPTNTITSTHTKQTGKSSKSKGKEHKNHQNVPIIPTNKIDTVDLHDMKLEDDVFIKLLNSMNGYNLKLLDCSDNNLGDASLDAVRNFLKETHINELDFSGNASSDLGCETFIHNLLEDNITVPQKLSLCFKSTDLGELSGHSTPNMIAELLKENVNIESLYLGGPVTAADALAIIDAIPHNSHIRELEFQSDHIKNYMNPDPEINQDVQGQFIVLASLIHSALWDKKSMCKLKSFTFPMLTEVFIYHEDICSQWLDVEKKLAQNALKK